MFLSALENSFGDKQIGPAFAPHLDRVLATATACRDGNVVHFGTFLVILSLSLFHARACKTHSSSLSFLLGIFLRCKNLSLIWTGFDGYLGNWDVSSAETMSCMFCGAKKFTGKGLDQWKDKLGNVKDMFNM